MAFKELQLCRVQQEKKTHSHRKHENVQHSFSWFVNFFLLQNIKYFFISNFSKISRFSFFFINEIPIKINNKCSPTATFFYFFALVSMCVLLHTRQVLLDFYFFFIASALKIVLHSSMSVSVLAVQHFPCFQFFMDLFFEFLYFILFLFFHIDQISRLNCNSSCFLFKGK